MIKILNYKREPAGKAAGYCIMRGYSSLANPFPVKPWGPYERGESLPLYREWLLNKITSRDPEVCREIEMLYDRWKKAGELKLVCCCKPKSCHGDHIKEVLELLDIMKKI